jgi:hypothetical protein
LATPTWITIILFLFYSITVISSLAGNMLVVVAISSSSSLCTPSNMFLVNLAISDMLLATLATPATLTQIVTRKWPLQPGKQDMIGLNSVRTSCEKTKL